MEIVFGFDREPVEVVEEYIEEQYEEGVDYEKAVGRGDDIMNFLGLKSKRIIEDKDLFNLIDNCNNVIITKPREFKVKMYVYARYGFEEQVVRNRKIRAKNIKELIEKLDDDYIFPPIDDPKVKWPTTKEEEVKFLKELEQTQIDGGNEYIITENGSIIYNGYFGDLEEEEEDWE